MTFYLKRNNIVVTGGSGRLGKLLQKKFKNFLYPKKKEFDITKISSIEKYVKKYRPKKIIHLAGLSRPLEIHKNNPEKSILLNIIGTSNLSIVCNKHKIKLIYFSTSYVYPGTKGNYKEDDCLKPATNYAWSKLGGETAVRMIKDFLILRVCMTEKPFIHKYALSDVFLNFTFQENIVEILPKLMNQKGIINVGGFTRTAYKFAKKSNPKVKKIQAKKIKNINYMKNMSMNINKLVNLIRDNKDLLKKL